MDEREIIREIKAGDTKSYALLVERYHRPLLSFILRIVGDKNLVEDIGQEVFFAVYRSLKTNSFDEQKGVPFSAWLFTAARNRCITVLRQRRQNSLDLAEIDSLEDGGKNPEEHLLAREQLAAVQESLQLIPEPFRKTIAMSLAGNSLEHIAVHQMITVGTVKSRLFRAKERLKLLLGAYYALPARATAQSSGEGRDCP